MEENTPDIPPRAAHTLCTALSVAGSDSCGGAGIQADLKTFSALGVYGMTAVTALTAQNTRGVQAVFPAGEACLRAQLEAVLSDVRPGAVKVGMVFGRAQVEILADALEAYRRYGFLKGTWLTLKRLSRCHPWGGSGYDPVP